MRVLIVDYYYSGFLGSFYRKRRDLHDAPYETQRAALRAELFGETAFEVDALRELGHEADDVIINALPERAAWAREHAIGLETGRRLKFRFRRGSIPWLAIPDGGRPQLVSRSALVPWPSIAASQTWMWQALFAQVREYGPDVVHVACMDMLPNSVVAELARIVPLVVGQVAATLPADHESRSYGLIVSSIPALVDRYRMHGTRAELVPLAFAPHVLEVVSARVRDIPISFVGSFSGSHPERARTVATVARATPLQVWTPSSRLLPLRSPIRRAVQGQAFGREMYEILARSRVTLNTHAAVADGAANNLRLFEATGMGALLLTESRPNLGDLFSVGSEVVAYDSPAHAADLARFYLDRPREAAAIARRGHVRTLRDHTWRHRMQKMTDLYSQALRIRE
jgi:spore maturation protein CgeB